MSRSALVLAALLCATGAESAPTVVRHDQPAFTLTVPDGFVRADPDRAPADLLDVFQRAGDLPGEPPMVLQVVHLDAVVPQRPLLPAERAVLCRADAFRFVDRVEHDRVLGFEVETLVGTTTLGDDVAVTRLATAVPLDDDAVLLVLLAPGHRAREARALLRSMLASARGATTWETPAQRTLNRLMRVTVVFTLLASVGWSLGAAVAGRRSALRPSTRLRANAALAALWWAITLWLCIPWRDHEWLFATIGLAAATTFTALARRARSSQAG